MRQEQLILFLFKSIEIALQGFFLLSKAEERGRLSPADRRQRD